MKSPLQEKTPKLAWKNVMNRLAFVILTAAYLVIFKVNYTEDLSPLFSYLGLIYNDPGPLAHILAATFALLPSGFIPLNLERPSAFVLALLYICVYIPSCYVPHFMALRPEIDVVLLNISLLIGLFLMALILRPMIRRCELSDHPKNAGRLFWFVIWGSFVLSAVWIIAVFGNNLRIVAISDVYSSGLRTGSRDFFEQSNVGYAVMMMYCAVNPMLIALGLHKQKKLLVLAGVSGQILCYSTNGAKVIIFSLLVTLVVHFVVRRHIARGSHILMALSFALLLGAHTFSRTSADTNPAAVLLQASISRAVAVPGQLTAEYQDYFESHPRLHLAGVKPFSWFLEYPLDRDVIFAITEYYEGNGDATSNAHFWAQEGIANFGLAGIVGMSVIVAMVLRAVDRIAARHDPCFSMMALSFVGFNLCNAPLSITLLSGGLLFSMVLMSLAQPQTSQFHAGGCEVQS